jgi:hypothetical protein
VMHPLYPEEPHRGPWPEDQCRKWVGDDPEDIFYVAFREVGDWQRAPQA